ncbi:MAG: sporulation integral membrane protein YtvI [Oscillospiraceae bacterium]|nr:sporulation integral membrane protein YtvI [Oscillospiraceae bacterium]
MQTQTEARRKFIINFMYWVILLGLAYICFKYALPLLMPFFLAFICSVALRPLIRFLNKKCRLGLNLASVITLLLFFIIILGIIFVIVLRLVKGALNLVDLLPGLYSNAIEPALTGLFGKLETIADRFDPSVQSFIDSATPQIISAAGNTVSSIASGIVGWVSSVATKVPSILVSLIMFVIGTVFITLGYERIVSFLKRQLSNKTVDVLTSIKQHFFIIIFKYGKSYLLILLITFAEIAVGLLIIGVDKAILIAAIIAVFDIFPIVGAGAILIPWAIVDLIIGNTTVGISLLILYGVEVAIRQIIEPKIVGEHVGLHPITTLISMFVGVKLFGGIGLFGLPITMAIVKNLNITGTFHFLKYDRPSKDAEQESGGEQGGDVSDDNGGDEATGGAAKKDEAAEPASPEEEK